MTRKSHGVLSPVCNVIIVGLDNFETEVIEAARPTLLECLHSSPSLADHLETLKKLSRSEKNKLKVCMLETSDIEAFRERLDIGGTPTFLVFQQGEEKGRLLGEVNEDILKNFVSRYVSEL